MAPLTFDDLDTDEDFFNYTKALSPAAVDLELRASLVTIDELRRFLRALAARLGAKRDFEAVQTYLAVFMRAHEDELVANTELREELENLLGVQKRESGRVLELITANLGMLAFVRDSL